MSGTEATGELMDRAALETASADAVEAQIRAKMERDFSPQVLEIVDDSASHAGHGGWRAEGATHFQMRIVSSTFIGMNRVQRQRAVMASLAEELASRVHALSISAETPVDGV